MDADEAPFVDAASRVSALRNQNQSAEEQLGRQIAEQEPIKAGEPDPDGFFAHPAWQRSLVIFAGPFMSFALGYLIIFGLTFTMGVPGAATNRVDTVIAGSMAARMGLKSGDEITKINGAPVTSGDDMVTTIHGSTGKKVTLVVLRGNTNYTLIGIPQRTVVDGQVFGTLGFSPVLEMQRLGVVDGFHLTNHITVLWLQQVGSLFSHPSITKFRQNAGGPIFIAKATKQAVDQGGDSVPILMAEISMSLAIFNLLPIPILDGGYLLLFFVETIRSGRRLTFEQQQNFMLAGLAVIGVLFVLIMFNDVSRAVNP
jgi:regulator of sigma E protease